MAQFLFQVAYTSDSWATQVREHGNVLERIQPLLDGCHGSVTAASTFGDYDCPAADFPGAEEAAFAGRDGRRVRQVDQDDRPDRRPGHHAMKRAEEVGRSYHPPVATSTAHRA
jgi:hypothetical protein